MQIMQTKLCTTFVFSCIHQFTTEVYIPIIIFVHLKCGHQLFIRLYKIFLFHI